MMELSEFSRGGSRRRDSAKTRLADLAQQAGVSTATVSRVLNNKPGVSPAARDQVFRALDLLGYDRPAKIQRPVGLIGLVIPELENPIFPAFAQGIEAIVARQGFTPLLCAQRAGGITEDEYVEMLLDHAVSGIVFVSGLHADTTIDPSRYRRLSQAGVPYVLINGYREDIDAPFVSCDDAAAVDLAVGHLRSLGHERIGLAIGPERLVPALRKRDRFLQLVEGGEASIASSLFTLEGGEAAGGELIDAGHTAIVCASDQLALGAYRAASARGLSIPRDVSITGFDDSPFLAFANPPLTTVRQPVQAMSNAAATLLLDEVSGKTQHRIEYLFQPELVVRDSTGAAPRP